MIGGPPKPTDSPRMRSRVSGSAGCADAAEGANSSRWAEGAGADASGYVDAAGCAEVAG